jgi:hypothetical protein
MMAARRVFEKLRQLAPYALIELLLPGGTLLALGLWLYRRRRDRFERLRRDAMDGDSSITNANIPCTRAHPLGYERLTRAIAHWDLV